MDFSGKVTSASLCWPLENVNIRVISKDDKPSKESKTNRKGKWNINVDNSYNKIEFYKDGFIKKTFLKEEKIPTHIRLLDDKLIGYQDKLWFLPGEKISVRVHSTMKYGVKLYRYGLSKEKKSELGQNDPSIQNVPDGVFVDIGLDWNESFNYTIPKDTKPGLYGLELSTKDEKFVIPFIVSTPREETNHSKILVLVSTNNWQSYNIWGGRSRYVSYEDEEILEVDKYKRGTGNTKLWKRLAKSIYTDIVPPFFKNIIINKILKRDEEKKDWMFKRLSVKRPFTNCSLEEDFPKKPFTNHLAAGEWRLLCWLERENIDYDIITGYELHQNPDILKSYKAIIFSTHCEYWSKEMYEGVKYYHENNGLWILNLSGNTMYRQIEFFSDGSTRCISLSFKESCADESKLIGVRFSGYDYLTCAPYKIIDPDHWVFDGVKLDKKTLMFGESSLNQNIHKNIDKLDTGRPGGGEYTLIGIGASGWETDQITDTAPDDIKLIAKGMNKNGGANMVVREPDGKRGGLFSASSITFCGCLLIDDVASGIIRNVLNKI